MNEKHTYLVELSINGDCAVSTGETITLDEVETEEEARHLFEAYDPREEYERYAATHKWSSNPARNFAARVRGRLSVVISLTRYETESDSVDDNFVTLATKEYTYENEQRDREAEEF